MKRIVQAQQALLERLPEFEGFRLRGCPGCHSGLDKLVISFDPPELAKRFDNTIRVPVRGLAQGPVV